MKYIRRRKVEFKFFALQATEVLYQKMHVYNTEAKKILSLIISQTEKDQPHNLSLLKSMYILMEKADERVIDCAHKLAPYQSPKLESIEVKNQVEHRFVLRAPAEMANVDDWMKKTGAERLKIEDLTPKIVKKINITPSIHDYDDSDDELETQKAIMN